MQYVSILSQESLDEMKRRAATRRKVSGSTQDCLTALAEAVSDLDSIALTLIALEEARRKDVVK